MAKKTLDDRTTPSIATKRPQQKKQDKKESKVKLAIEQVQASIAKAETKLAKLKGRVEAHMSQLHELEAKLAAMRGVPQKMDKDSTAQDSDHQQSQPEPQKIAAHEDVPTKNSSNEENHSNTSFEESQTDLDPSIQQAEASPVATMIDEQAEETVTASQEGSETPPVDVEGPAEEIRIYKRSPISDLKGIPLEMRKNLESEGITNTQQFLDNTRTQQQRKQLANKVGTTPDALVQWVNCADLMRLRGVGGAFSIMLNEAGVHNCRELQTCEPEQLYATLETIHNDKKFRHHIPPLSQVSEWITEAKTLDATSPE